MKTFGGRENVGEGIPTPPVLMGCRFVACEDVLRPGEDDEERTLFPKVEHLTRSLNMARQDVKYVD